MKTATKGKRARGAAGLFGGLAVTLFAGLGGSCLGMEWGLGRAVDVAVNHNAHAIRLHQINHPHTRHLQTDVWDVDPDEATGGRDVDVVWASPDCTHFSAARGKVPVKKNIRSLAWVMAKWAAKKRPLFFFLENVKEFRWWGPLIQIDAGGGAWEWEITFPKRVGKKKGKPLVVHGPHRDQRDQVKAFKAAMLEKYPMGKVEPRLIPDPTRKGETFKRFVSRMKSFGYVCDFKELDAANYGAPTHRKRLFGVFRLDGKPIVWPTPTHGPGRKFPWRTCAECLDFSLPCPSIFERERPLAEKTMHRIAMGIKRFVLENQKPFIVRVNHGGEEFRGQSVDSPLGTVTQKLGYALCSPLVVGVSGAAYAGKPKAVDVPGGTVMPNDRRAMVELFLQKHEVAIASTLVEVANSTWNKGYRDPNRPSHAITATPEGGSMAMAAATMIRMGHGDKQAFDLNEPIRVIEAQGNKWWMVYAFLTKYFGTAIGTELSDPLHTITGKPRFGLVTVVVEGETYVIVDIGLRMLTPRELARCQGFPDDFFIEEGSKADQVARIGNSVCPQMAEALVRANVDTAVPAWPEKRRAA